MKSYIVNEVVIDSILKYLMTRPYAEVAQGVQLLQAIKQSGNKDVKEPKKKGGKPKG